MNGNAVLAAILGAHLTLIATVAQADDIGGTGRIEPDGGVVVLNGVQGARIHDFLHAVAADKTSSDELLTRNTNDFAILGHAAYGVILGVLYRLPAS